jgi:hypothetical protein
MKTDGSTKLNNFTLNFAKMFFDKGLLEIAQHGFVVCQ